MLAQARSTDRGTEHCFMSRSDLETPVCLENRKQTFFYAFFRKQEFRAKELSNLVILKSCSE